MPESLLQFDASELVFSQSSNSCPDGYVKMGARDECQQTQGYTRYGWYGNGTWSDWPGGCDLNLVDNVIEYNSHSGTSKSNMKQICQAEGPPPPPPEPTPPPPEPTPPPATSPAGCTILVDTPSAAERKAVCLCECKALVTADFLCPSWAWQETNEACPNSGDGNVCDYMCNRIGHSGYQTGGVRHASIGHNDNNFNNTGQPKLKSFTFVKMQVNTMVTDPGT